MINKRQIIAENVFKRRLLSLSYYWMIFAPFLLLIISGSIAYFASKTVAKNEPKIAVVAQPKIKQAVETLLLKDDYQLNQKLNLHNHEEIKRALAKKKVDGVLLIAKDFKQVSYFYQTGNDKNLPTQELASILNQLKSSLVAQSVGLTAKQWQEITAVVPFKTVALKQGKANEANKTSAQIISMIVVVILFVIISSYVGIVGSELGNEKSSHLIEALLAAVPAKEHFNGKMLGVIYLICFQVLVYTLVGGLSYLVLNVTGYNGIIKKFQLSKLWLSFTPQFWIIIALIIILSLVFYILLTALLTAYVSRVEDINQISTLVTFLAMLPYILGIMALSAPNMLINKVLSYVPFTLSGPMVVRLALGEVDILSGWLAVIIMFVSICGLYYLAASVYQRNALTYSNKTVMATIIQILRRK